MLILRDREMRRGARATEPVTSVGCRRAFTLPEMLIVLALIATLSAVLYPAIMNKLTEARAAAIAQTLDGINQAVQNYRGNVGRFPRTLGQLSTKPPTGALNLCNDTVPNVNVNQWRGPYASRTFVSAGTQVGDGTVQDVIRRVPPTGASTFGVAYVDVMNVDSAVASRLERTFDGDNTLNASGTIQWLPDPAGNVGRVSFGIPVRGC